MVIIKARNTTCFTRSLITIMTVLTVSLGGGHANAQTEEIPPAAPSSSEKLNTALPSIQVWRTANGARVYFVAAAELPMMDIRIVFDAGSARDGTKKGVGLLTSRLLGEGAGTLSADDIAERFENLGARFGTSAHRDMSIVSLRSLTDKNLAEPAIKTLQTVLTQPNFPLESFERERRRTLIGIQARKESPDAIAEKTLYTAVFGQHPYASPTLGTEETVKAFTLDDVKQHYQHYYVARNATVAIVGALDRAQAEALANTLVGSLPSGLAAPNLPIVAEITAAQTIQVNHPSMQTHVLVGQPGMRRGDYDYFPLFVGNHILGGSGLVSRLSDEIREKRGLSYSVSSDFSPMHVKGPFTIGLQTRNDQATEALNVSLGVLRDFVKNGPTEAELSGAKQNITGGFPLRIASNSSIVEYLAMIGFYLLPLNYLDVFTTKVEAVTAKQIQNAFERRIHPDRLVTVIVGGPVAKTDKQ